MATSAPPRIDLTASRRQSDAAKIHGDSSGFLAIREFQPAFVQPLPLLITSASSLANNSKLNYISKKTSRLQDSSAAAVRRAGLALRPCRGHLTYQSRVRVLLTLRCELTGLSR